MREYAFSYSTAMAHVSIAPYCTSPHNSQVVRVNDTLAASRYWLLRLVSSTQ
jgi:hypothetical protein